MSTKVCIPLFYTSRAFGFVSLLTFVFFFPCVTDAADGQGAEPVTQQTVESVYQLDTMVVTGTKTPVPLSAQTSAVEVISEKDFLRQNSRLLTDSLQLGQSLAVFSSGGPGTNATARIRGGSSAQTLVFIDGALMNSGTLGGFNVGMLTTDNIQSVTILRGAQSMLWGSDAMGGVIDIQTKRGDGPLLQELLLNMDHLIRSGKVEALVGSLGLWILRPRCLVGIRQTSQQ
jgi:outer membrane cobalamin receptor